MQSILSWLSFCAVFALTWEKADLESVSEKVLKEMKREWMECCKTNVCIRNSCYTTTWRASGWSAVRQRCQGKYPEWPYAVDIFRIQKEDDIKALLRLFQNASHYSSDNSYLPTDVWTSGTRCPKAAPSGTILTTRWTSTNETFPNWMVSKIPVVADSDDSCKFLVISLAVNNTDIKYDFQDQSARHIAICEFVFPEDVKSSTIYDVTEESTSTWETDGTKTQHTETDTTFVSTTETSAVKSHTLGTAGGKFGTRSSPNLKTITQPVKPEIKEPTTSELLLSTIKISLYCKGLKFAGIDWPDTAPGATANKSCPDGMMGYAQWICDEKTLKFTPPKPHIQDCKHVWVKDLEADVEDGNDAVAISHKLADETEKQEMSHGDISALVDLSAKIFLLYSRQKGEEEFDVSGEKKKPVSYVFTQSMVSSISNILKAKIETAWEILPEAHQTRAASKILKLVTTMGSQLSCIRSSRDNLQFTVTAENIDLQTFILKNTNQNEDDLIVFPQPTAGVKASSLIYLPSNIRLKDWYSPCKKYNSAVGVVYNHVGDFLKDEQLLETTTKVATKLISFSLSNNTDSVTLPEGKEVVVILQHILPARKHVVLKNPRCMFWNFSKQTYGQWDSSGCQHVNTNITHTVCKCNHLTNFAVLMDVNNNIGEDKILSMMTYVCCGVSSFTLILTLICFLTIRSLHGRRSIITSNLCLSLLITNLLIIFGLDQTDTKVVCAAIAGLLHFWILSAFCWMLVEGYHLYRMVILVFQRGSTLSVKLYYAFSYGTPLVVVSISAGVKTSDYGGENYCWLSSKDGLMWSFVGPACVIILVNIVIFTLTLRSASSVKIKREQSTLKKIKSWVRGSMSVMCLLGLTWCLGLFYIDKNLSVFSYLFTLFNGLQGVFIFLFHILLNDKVNAALLSKCKGNKHHNKRKFLNQTSSNRLHSKTSTRTSIAGGTSSYPPVLNSRGLPSTGPLQRNSITSNGFRRNLHDTKEQNVRPKNYNINYVKSKATHTVSDKGFPRTQSSQPFKLRSQSVSEETGNSVYHIGKLHTQFSKEDYKRRQNGSFPVPRN